jgi:integrase
MSLYKRGTTWWARFTTASGERIRCSTGTTDKAQAQEFHDQLKTEAWRVQKLGEKPNYSWDDAGVKYLKETAHKRTHEEDRRKLRWLQQFLRGKPLREVNRMLVQQIAEAKVKESSAQTANRYLALIRAILRKAAHEWEWIDSAPKVRLYPEPKGRIRWLTPEQARKLLAELPDHQRDVALFALATGLRQSNVLQLQWSQVDLARSVCWIFADQAKAGRDIHVSLSSLAKEVLTRQIGKHLARVFTFRGRPLNSINTKSWHAALTRAGIENFRWHDLRHTFTSWLAQSGTPMHVLQQMGAWESSSMVRRYAHLAPAHLAVHAEVIAEMLADTKLAQLQSNKGL